MSALTLTLLRFGFLLAIWVFILFIIALLRRDLTSNTTSRPLLPGYQWNRSTNRRERREAARQQRLIARRVVVVRGSHSGVVIELGGVPITLGRAGDSTLVLDDEYCSNRHARLIPRADGRWLVEDLGSTNGTFLNEQKITGPTLIPLGTAIRIGRTELELRR
jgi:hypothetical protein